MIKKEKIFELKIQEDDEVSGIDSISLVDEPAIEVNWVAFKKEVQEDFHIPDGEDETYLGKLLSKGQSEQELLDEGWEIDRIESVKENFATTPNDTSYQDNSFYRVRYKYSLNSNIKQSAIIPTTRQFCRELISKNYVWRIEEVENEINSFGQSAQFWRGGYNCRHEWFRIFYKKSGDIINKSSINKGKITDGDFPIELSPEWLQPDTVTDKTMANPSPSTIKNLGLSKEDFAGQKVSIDYDDTLSTLRGQQLARRLMNEGRDLYIITRRLKTDLAPVYRVADQLGISHDKVHATNGKLKWETIKRLGIKKHIDNNPDELKAIQDNLEGVITEKFEVGVAHYTEDGKLYTGPTHKDANGRLMTGKVHTEDSVYLYHGDELEIEPNPCWEGYEPIGLKEDGSPNCVPIREDMESVSDYPVSISNNAKRGIELNEKNNNKCATQVGKVRSQQLANGEPISSETIKRMYSYLSRAATYYDENDSNACGTISYLLWGGKSALSWAESKLKDFGYDVGSLPSYVDELPKKKKYDNQHFATDSEKHIVLGPAMIPDQKIFRKDANGNPYYVFFSPDTIKMIAEKYMRNKYTDNNDTMHDGKAIKDIHVLESWIKEDTQDKSSKYGFENLPVGTWFVSMKVNNPKIWEEVKSGKLNGFSVSGFFSEVAQFTKEEMFLYKVAEVLKNIKE
jgi:hypothetical protein